MAGLLSFLEYCSTLLVSSVLKEEPFINIKGAFLWENTRLDS